MCVVNTAGGGLSTHQDEVFSVFRQSGRRKFTEGCGGWRPLSVSTAKSSSAKDEIAPQASSSQVLQGRRWTQGPHPVHQQAPLRRHQDGTSCVARRQQVPAPSAQSMHREKPIVVVVEKNRYNKTTQQTCGVLLWFTIGKKHKTKQAYCYLWGEAFLMVSEWCGIVST